MAKMRGGSVPKQIASAIKAAAKPSLPWCEGLIDAIDIGLAIKEMGPVKLPMRPADVRKLMSVVSRAPYGKGTKTIVDTGVRDTLEVDGERIELAADFLEAIQVAGREIAQGLQLDYERLQIDLYKLLIYPKGGFFLPHRDSEKRKGMVATMIVVLPSKFGGGGLRINHGGRHQTFSFDEARAQKQPQYAAFFADCEHEVKKVTSGVRVCLAFNLILKPQRRSKKSNSDSVVDPALRNQVANWIQHRSSDPLVFALDHQYTEAGLKPERLKGADKDLHRNIAAVASALDCRLYFGQVERHLCQFADDGSYGYGRRGYRRWSGNYDDLTIGEAYDDEIVIDGWRHADGQPAKMAPLACDSTQLVSLVPAEDWVPTRQDYEGYTGNAGNTLDRWYHKSAIAIWPSPQHFAIVVQMGLSFAVAELLDLRANLHGIAEDELERACDDCQELAEAIIDHWPDRKHDRGEVGRGTQRWPKQFASELPKFDDPDLIERFLGVVSAKDWQTNLDQFVLTSLRRMGVEEILPLLHRMLDFEPPANQYGVRFLEGLATRDAKWLLRLAKEKKRGGLSPDELNKLLSVATNKLQGHVAELGQKTFSRSTPPAECWAVLCQAIIAAKDSRLSEMLQLADNCPAVFDFRSVRVPAAVTLRDFAVKQHREMPDALKDWIDELKDRLVDETSAKPQPPSNFRRESKTNCNCKHCKQLSEFLVDPTKERTEIPAAERNRRHLQQVIYSNKIDVSAKTIRSGSPYSLGLTKTTASHKVDLKRYRDDLKLLSTLQ